MGSVAGLRLLLDTHVWVNSILEPRRLTPPVARALENPDHELWLSAISIWEVSILIRKGRIHVEDPKGAWIRASLLAWPMVEAPVTIEIALAADSLAASPTDPADRILVATALVLDLTLVTADKRLLKQKQIKVLLDR